MEEYTVVIMCAGDGKRWNNYKKVPKQLIKINNEPIIYRTIRLLKQRDFKNIIITTHKDAKPFNVKLPQIINYWDYEIERFYYVKGNVIYLYGDTYYTEDAMNKILYDDFNFYGRKGGSLITGKPYEEIFAVKGDGDKIRECVEKVRELYKEKKIKRCIGWELYEAYHNLPITYPVPSFEFLGEINDETEDFDSPEDYEEYIKRI